MSRILIIDKWFGCLCFVYVLSCALCWADSPLLIIITLKMVLEWTVKTLFVWGFFVCVLFGPLCFNLKVDTLRIKQDKVSYTFSVYFTFFYRFDSARYFGFHLNLKYYWLCLCAKWLVCLIWYRYTAVVVLWMSLRGMWNVRLSGFTL